MSKRNCNKKRISLISLCLAISGLILLVVSMRSGETQPYLYMGMGFIVSGQILLTYSNYKNSNNED